MEEVKRKEKELVLWFMTSAKYFLEQTDRLVDEYNLKDTQFVLDFYDEVNKISVRK